VTPYICSFHQHIDNEINVCGLNCESRIVQNKIMQEYLETEIICMYIIFPHLVFIYKIFYNYS